MPLKGTLHVCPQPCQCGPHRWPTERARPCWSLWGVASPSLMALALQEGVLLAPLLGSLFTPQR